MTTDISTFLIFRIQESLYAISISNIEKIIFLPKITPFSETCPPVIGFINYHEEVTPVIDMHLFLGFPFQQYSLQDYLVIFRENNNTFGIVISNIIAVGPLKKEDQISSNHHLQSLDFLSLWNEEIVYVLNFEILKQALNKKDKTSHDYSLNFIEQKDAVTFTERAEALATPVFQKESYTKMVFSIVQVNKEFYGIDPLFIKEYSTLGDITPIPFSPPHLLGFINLRGSILPVLDIWLFMKMQSIDLKKASKVMIINFEEISLGIVVNDVVDVFAFPEEDFQIHSSKGATESYISQTIRYKNGILGILDVKKIMESLMMRSK